MAVETGNQPKKNNLLISDGRNEKGRFIAGNKIATGPGKSVFDFRTLARQYAPEALDTLVSIMRGDCGARTADMVKAADIIMDRAYGKPSIAIEVGQSHAAPDLSMMDEAEKMKLKEAAFTIAMQSVKDSLSDEVIDVEGEEVHG